jgi:L-threonylcarbamoyladenylate synthase
MQTEMLSVDPHHPDPEILCRAVKLLQHGELVAFPTETVYGLGANALDENAVRKVFAAKGRPATNPIIVHVSSPEAARELVVSWPEAAQRLAEKFWPGSLTLVLPRANAVPEVVTAGGSTVALRIPAHPVALALLETTELPIAAPSANRSSHLSPTRAEHVLGDLGGRIPLLLDAGPTPGGLESTVLDLTTTVPRLLRPGLVTPAQIESVIGPIQRPGQREQSVAPLRSPGMLAKHYAPRAPLECVDMDAWDRIRELLRDGWRVGWVALDEESLEDHPYLIRIALPLEPMLYAARLYAVLHQLDAANVDRIVVSLPPNSDEWLAVLDRLRRAEGR